MVRCRQNRVGNQTGWLQRYYVAQDYTIEFEMVNYTNDSSNFLGINRSWENKIYETITPAPNDMVDPAGIEI